MAAIAGPALAGVIAGAWGAVAAIETQMTVGAVLALLIATDSNFELRPEHDEVSPTSIRDAVLDGLRSLWSIVPLRWNVITGMLYVSAWGTLTIGFPAYAISVGAGAHAAGYLWAAIAVGSMSSAFLYRTRALHLHAPVLIGCSFLAMALSVAAWPLAGGLAGALALALLTGGVEGPSLVALLSVRQRLAPPQLRGQIFSTVSSLNLAASAAGSGLAGLFHEAFGTTATLLGFGALLGTSGLLALLAGGR